MTVTDDTTCLNRTRSWHSKDSCLRCLRQDVDAQRQRLEELEQIVTALQVGLASRMGAAR